MGNTIQRVEAEVLDHVGIASDIIDQLDLVKIIDSLIPKKASHFKVTHGESIKAIILSGLGFQDRRLYSVDRYFKHRPVERMFGRNLTWRDFNDDVLASTLDKIHEYGVSNFFFDVVGKILLKNKNLFNFVGNVDTTSLSMQGKFKRKNLGIRPSHGHSKDKRPDLLQMVLSMGISGPAKIPFWMDVHDGNVSDKELLPQVIERIESFKNHVYGNSQKMLYVADSALFSKNFVEKFYYNSQWITRLSESYKFSKDLLRESAKDPLWKKYGKYRYFSKFINYNSYLLRVIVIHHRKSAYREFNTLKKNYLKKSKKLRKEIELIERKVFKSKKEIEKRVEKIAENYPYFDIEWQAEQYRIRYTIEGKIKKKCIRYRFKGFQAKINFEINKGKLLDLANKKGKFILVTNVKDEKKFSDREIINFYRNQGNIERGFRFIKDKSFGLGQIYLKRPDRISSLICTMVLTLMVNNFGEYLIRKKLSKKEAFFKNQLGLKTFTPTLKWIFQSFQNVVLVKIHLKNKVLEYFCNIDREHLALIKCLGKEAHKIYGLA